MQPVRASDPALENATSGPSRTPREPGALLATFGTSRSFVAVFALLAALFVGVGVFLLWLHGQVVSHGMNFSGDAAILSMTGFASVALGAAALLLAWSLTRRQVTIHLHENGLRTVGGGQDQLDYFEDIQDVYRVSTGLFGWRSAPGAAWTKVDNRVSRGAQLRDELVSRQIAQRGDVLWQRLQAGGSVVFHLFAPGAAQGQIWWRAGNVDHPVSPVVLTAHSLTMAGVTMPLAQLRAIDRSIWHETIKFMAVEGTEFHRTPSNAILSLDLLLVLIEELQRPAG
jgi:membrane protein implicated in regulation of membrane protease activity